MSLRAAEANTSTGAPPLICASYSLPISSKAFLRLMAADTVISCAGSPEATGDKERSSASKSTNAENLFTLRSPVRIFKR
jgi:hypothetical protein